VAGTGGSLAVGTGSGGKFELSAVGCGLLRRGERYGQPVQKVEVFLRRREYHGQLLRLGHEQNA